MIDSMPPKARDSLAVRSRISWGAIAAGAMAALAIYLVLTLLGLALGMELLARGRGGLGAGAAIYSIVALLLAMFLGGWATSRLAVGESKLEAALYGVVLWGVLFTGMFWLIACLPTGTSASESSAEMARPCTCCAMRELSSWICCVASAVAGP